MTAVLDRIRAPPTSTARLSTRLQRERPLRRAVECEIVDPLSGLIASHRIEAGDIVEVELDRERLAFFRVGRGGGSGKVDTTLG